MLLFFENVTKRGNRIKVEPSSRYLTTVKELIKKPLNIDQMLKMNHEQFYSGGGTKEGIANNYALAWGEIVYFLHEAAPRIKRTRKHDYTKIIKKYYYYIRKNSIRR